MRYGQLSPGRYWLYWGLFYIGIPVLLALELGASEASSATFKAKHHFFLYFLVANLPSWWAKGLLTWVVQWVLRPWSPPLLVVLIVGSILATHVSGIWAPLRHSFFEPYLADGSTFYSVFPWRYDDPDYLLEAVVAGFTGGAIWVAANYFFLKVLRFPRFGYGVDDYTNAAAQEGPGEPRGAKTHKIEASAEPSAGQSAQGSGKQSALHILTDQLPEKLGRNIIALKAEEHYTRIFTDTGEALVLMRFRDAVGLLEDLGGVQTHRSYWVNPAYVSGLEREGRNSQVCLSTGMTVPVSRSYRVLVQRALEDAATSA